MKVGQKYVSKIILDDTEYDRGYQEGREDAIEQMNILGLVNFKLTENPIIRKAIIEIDYDDRLNSEQVVAIILEQLKEQKE